MTCDWNSPKFVSARVHVLFLLNTQHGTSYQLEWLISFSKYVILCSENILLNFFFSNMIHLLEFLPFPREPRAQFQERALRDPNAHLRPSSYTRSLMHILHEPELDTPI